ncbi:MAG: serine/threonine protein kinase [Solirubrobacterales bacterium]|nr:serine/threonine protein kinase [Solirubrobacterales bacterium]
MKSIRCLLLPGVLLACAAPAAADTGPRPTPGETRSVILAGNNWDGTTDVIDPYTLERLDRINVIPDKAEREAEIALDPVKAAYFTVIREQVGEGHNQYNDDVFSSHDGRTIYVSRPSFADVVAIDLATKKIVWRTPVGGYRADHMAISPDGTKLLVSASTANIVDQVDTATGKITGSWNSGDSPHENNYSADGSTIYHAAIGRVYTPTDTPEEDRTTKGKRVFQIVDAKTLKVKKELDMGAKLAEAGFPDMSSAVRPMAIAPGEKWLYFQVSFFHGFVEYDLVHDKVTRIAKLPVSAATQKLQRSDYLLDSAHHGLAMNPAGTKLCVAGTMSDYGAIVDRKTFAYQRINGIKKPYWSTNSYDGRHCYISGSGDDALWVISYAAGKKLAKIPVGDHPQRVRNGVARFDIYPRAGIDEPFRFAVKAPTTTFTVGRGREAIGCRAAGAQDLRLASCIVRILEGRTELATGERIVRDSRGFAVDVDLTKAGAKRLRATGKTVAATLVATGVDSTGRAATIRRKVALAG